MEVVASLSQGRTAAAQCGLFTHKSVPVIFEPPCNLSTSVTKHDVMDPPVRLYDACVTNNVSQIRASAMLLLQNVGS